MTVTPLWRLHIDRMNDDGEGVAHHEGVPVAVPFAVEGDVADIRPLPGERTHPRRAHLERIVTPSPHRVLPPCPVFTRCGGCRLQHLEMGHYQDFKRNLLLKFVRQAGYEGWEKEVRMVFVPPASRRRAELKIRLNGGAALPEIGYYAASSHELVATGHCAILSPALQAALPDVRRLAALLPVSCGVHAAVLLDGENGVDVLLHVEALPAQTALAAQMAALLTGSAGRIIRISLSAPKCAPVPFVMLETPYVTLAGVTIPATPGMFLQSTRDSLDAMLRLVRDHLRKKRRVLDLFSGLGGYGFALAEKKRTIHGFEGDAELAALSAAAIRREGLEGRMRASQRDLFRYPLSPQELKDYDGAVINPPRAGAKEQCAALAASGIGTVVMVSCNPATFARDAAMLRGGGYTLRSVTGIDQFVWSAHLEIVAAFEKPQQR